MTVTDMIAVTGRNMLARCVPMGVLQMSTG